MRMKYRVKTKNGESCVVGLEFGSIDLGLRGSDRNVRNVRRRRT